MTTPSAAGERHHHRGYRLPYILALRYQTVDGKTYNIGEGELAKDLIFGMMLAGG